MAGVAVARSSVDQGQEVTYLFTVRGRRGVGGGGWYTVVQKMISLAGFVLTVCFCRLRSF